MSMKDDVENYLKSKFGSGPVGAPDSTLQGLQNIANKEAGVRSDVNDANAADAVDPVVVASSDTPKMADGGVVSDDDKFEDPVPGPEWGRDFYPDSTGYKHITEYGTAADGGVVDEGPADDGSVDLSQLPGGSSQPPPPSFDPKAGLPPELITAPQSAQPMASPDISQYIAQQKAQNNAYGPQQQQAVLQSILQRQNGLRGGLANGLAGLADAFTGAGGGHGEQQANLQNRQNAQGQLQLETLNNQRQTNQQNVGANQKLDAMDPNSTLSKAAQASQGLTLAALGFDPRTISKMSASEIPEAISTLKDLGLKDREIMVAKYKANIEANQLAESSRHNRAEEGAKSTELAQTAKQQQAENAIKGEEVGAGELEHAATEPLTSRIAGALGFNPAGSALQNQALGSASNTAAISPAPVVHVVSQQQYDSLPKGTHYVDSTGQRKVKGGQ